MFKITESPSRYLPARRVREHRQVTETKRFRAILIKLNDFLFYMCVVFRTKPDMFCVIWKRYVEEIVSRLYFEKG